MFLSLNSKFCNNAQTQDDVNKLLYAYKQTLIVHSWLQIKYISFFVLIETTFLMYHQEVERGGASNDAGRDDRDAGERQ
jgi:hypothetical protein